MQLINEVDIFMSPLDDPVFGAIYANAEVAGLAMESLVKAVFDSDNESFKGKIESITPQQVHLSPTERGFRVDVEVKTDTNERWIIEVQVNTDSHILLRNLVVASHVFYGSSDKGDNVWEMARKLPKVIHINILGFVLRKGSRELLEPFKIMYTKKPKEVAIPHFYGYNIQLPNVENTEQDFTNSLYSWCYILYKAHKERKTAKEVLDMTPTLQKFARVDAGFDQFCKRYAFVTTDPESRKKHLAWVLDCMKIQGQIDAAYEDGIEKGIEKGKIEGKTEGIEEVALNMIQKGLSIDVIKAVTGFSKQKLAQLEYIQNSQSK